jgi:hypothetical protein
MLGLVLTTLALAQDPVPPAPGPEGAIPAPEAAAPDAPALEVQRPQASEDEAPAPAEAASSEPAASAAASEAREPAPAPAASTPGTGPSAAGPSAEDPAPAPAGEPEASPFGDLLAPGESDEPEARPRPAPSRAGRNRGDMGVSKDEAMRRYYAALYRPAHNPARATFGFHSSIAVLGSDQTDLNGRVGTLDAEGGVSWNKFSFALGAGFWAGSVLLDPGGDLVSPLGVSGLATLGLGRIGYTKRAILDIRLGYRATYMPLKAGRVDSPEPEADSIIPHGPELRFDASFMISRVREPRFFHAVGVSLDVQLVPHTVGMDLPFYAIPRIGLVYSFS